MKPETKINISVLKIIPGVQYFQEGWGLLVAGTYGKIQTYINYEKSV